MLVVSWLPGVDNWDMTKTFNNTPHTFQALAREALGPGVQFAGPPENVLASVSHAVHAGPVHDPVQRVS